MNSILEINNIVKKFGDTVALDGINLSIPAGSISFLIGLNGAGKTTLLRLIVGQTIADSGELVIADNLKISAMIETPAFCENMNAYENMKYIAVLRGCDDARINELLSLVGLDKNNRKSVKKYSVGMRQRLKLAISMLNNPDLIILDEPLSGLDPEGIYSIKKLIKEINKQFGTTIILSSHLIKETEELATDYFIIDKGKIIENFNKQQLDEKLFAYELTSAEFDILRKKEFNYHYRIDDSNKVYVYFSGEKSVETIFADDEINFKDRNPKITSLDMYFLALVRGENNGI